MSKIGIILAKKWFSNEFFESVPYHNVHRICPTPTHKLNKVFCLNLPGSSDLDLRMLKYSNWIQSQHLNQLFLGQH